MVDTTPGMDSIRNFMAVGIGLRCGKVEYGREHLMAWSSGPSPVDDTELVGPVDSIFLSLSLSLSLPLRVI
ncbi:hypothetical protein LWI28_027308 [Acer negundo]|uniref:Uncharacterized protein n=1 Tax=Acer negundo TaxID=4023 RepID=A0AAD5JY60_ACENE|nr:hypothetical protein LWI28_027308 [Acer negundo]